jgi:DNA (cytosine-5)-methyltransferase 1
MDKTIVELFAGVGGFRLGLEKTPGWKTVWTNQWEPSTTKQHAYDIYVRHFGKEKVSNEDINLVDKKTIPDHTLLVGGFPCQDYSVARTKAEGIQGKKGVLWWSILDVIKAKNPPFILLENVDRLIKSPASQRGRDFGVMLRTLDDLGYSLEWRVINAADYGFVQRRRRVFMFGAHKSTTYYKALKKQDIEDNILSYGFFASTFPVKKSVEFKINKYDISPGLYNDLVGVSDHFKANFMNSGILINGTIYTSKTTPKEVSITPLKTIVENSVDDKYLINSKDKLSKFEYMKGSKKIKRTDKNGYEYYYSEGGMDFPDSLDKPGRTILTSEASVNRSTHVIEDLKTKQLRLLTPKECERMNGFNDDWTAFDYNKEAISDRKRYFLMGNALVVGLVEKMGQRINEILQL